MEMVTRTRQRCKFSFEYRSARPFGQKPMATFIRLFWSENNGSASCDTIKKHRLKCQFHLEGVTSL
jgi:hypothetical protein